MAEQLSTLTPFRVLDANGDPISGAKAYFYETGTSNLETVYTTSALSTAHPSPLVADSQGKFPPVWHSGSPALKVVITDASDVEINGSPLDPAPMTSSATTAANISFTPVANNPANNVQEAIENASSLGRPVETRATNYTFVAGDRGKYIRCTADMTLTLLAASVAGDGWDVMVEAYGGDVTFTPDGSDTINATTLLDGQIATLYCDGSGWRLESRHVTASKIQEYNVTAAGAVDITLPNDRFTHYRVIVSDLAMGTSGADLRLRTSSDGGSNFDDGASDYFRQILIAAGASVSSTGATAGSYICTPTLDDTNAARVDLLVTNPGGTEETGFNNVYSGVNNSSVFVSGTAGGQRSSTTAVNALRFYPQFGVMAGKFTLYGLG